MLNLDVRSMFAPASQQTNTITLKTDDKLSKETFKQIGHWLFNTAAREVVEEKSKGFEQRVFQVAHYTLGKTNLFNDEQLTDLATVLTREICPPIKNVVLRTTSLSIRIGLDISIEKIASYIFPIAEA